jgi:adenylate kinase family enzyme
MGMHADIGRRIVIYGPSGSGKSTLGRKLGERLGLPYIELDAIFYYRPNWEDRPVEDFRAEVTKLLMNHPEGWIFDGNYSMVRDLILPHADTVVWLRLPFRIVYSRLVRRTLGRSWRHESLWGTNVETWRKTFSREGMLWWGIRHWREHHRKTEAALREAPAGAEVIVLRRPAEVAALVERAEAVAHAAPSLEA